MGRFRGDASTLRGPAYVISILTSKTTFFCGDPFRCYRRAAFHGVFSLSYDVPDTDIVPALSLPPHASPTPPFHPLSRFHALRLPLSNLSLSLAPFFRDIKPQSSTFDPMPRLGKYPASLIDSVNHAVNCSYLVPRLKISLRNFRSWHQVRRSRRVCALLKRSKTYDVGNGDS